MNSKRKFNTPITKSGIKNILIYKYMLKTWKQENKYLKMEVKKKEHGISLKQEQRKRRSHLNIFK